MGSVISLIGVLHFNEGDVAARRGSFWDWLYFHFIILNDHVDSMHGWTTLHHETLGITAKVNYVSMIFSKIRGPQLYNFKIHFFKQELLLGSGQHREEKFGVMKRGSTLTMFTAASFLLEKGNFLHCQISKCFYPIRYIEMNYYRE